MLASSHHASNHVDGPPKVGAVGHAAVPATLGWRGCEAVDGWSDHPFVAEIVEMGVKTADKDAGIVAQPVIHRAAEAIASPVVSVKSDVFGAICPIQWRGVVGTAATVASRCWTRYVRYVGRWLKVVDAASVIVIRPSEKDAQPFV